MALDVSVTNSTRRDCVEVRWRTFIYYYPAYVVTVADTDVFGKREWIAVIRDSSVTTIQLDTTGLQQASGLVTVQGCSSQARVDFGSKYLVNSNSQACRRISLTSTSAVVAAADVGVNGWREFISRIIWRLIPRAFVSFANWIGLTSAVGRPSTRSELAANRIMPLYLSTSEFVVGNMAVEVMSRNHIATVRWSFDGGAQFPDRWMLTIINLTWTVDDLRYHQWIYIIDSQRCEFRVPLSLQSGNRYRVIVLGLKQQRPVASATADCFDVLWRGLADFRAGDVLTKDEVQQLKNAAIRYLQRSPDAVCTWFYRNKPRIYFEKVFSSEGGVMKTLIKDASGDERSPINGEISGLFFLANVDYKGLPFDASLFGDTRLLVRADMMLSLAPNMYFADFYCMNGKDHYVTLVLARPGSYADRLCEGRLPKLSLNDRQNNPFIFMSDGKLRVPRGKALFVEVFFTENLNSISLIQCGEAKIQYNVRVFGSGSATQGGRRKSTSCSTCMIPKARYMAHPMQETF